MTNIAYTTAKTGNAMYSLVGSKAGWLQLLCVETDDDNPMPAPNDVIKSRMAWIDGTYRQTPDGTWEFVAPGYVAQDTISQDEAQETISEAEQAQDEDEDEAQDEADEDLTEGQLIGRHLRGYARGYIDGVNAAGTKTKTNGDGLAAVLLLLTPEQVGMLAGPLLGLSPALYDDKNSGMQRMNWGNRLRAALKKDTITWEQIEDGILALGIKIK